jgi:hypothetical protein
MANDVVKFVDSIAASPTTRLDLNDGTTFTLGAAIVAPPPQIRSTVSSNAMTDGGFQSSSRYDYRVIHLELILNVATQDAAATALQNLHRELDRETNYLKWQPDTAAAPVFFKTWRTSPLQIVDQPAARAVYYVTLEIPAEPFALGLRKSISALTVNNDPAAASRGNFYDIASADAIGDAAAPLLIHETSFTHTSLLLAQRSQGTPSDLVFFKQCESMTLGTDTTNPGGAADAAMSGSGTTNYARTSFATATMQIRVTWDIDAEFNTSAEMEALRGSYRLYAMVRYNSGVGTNVLTLRAALSNGSQTGPDVDIVDTTNRQIVDLGTFTFGGDSINGDTLPVDPSGNTIQFSASRTSGAGSMDWDCVYLIPNDTMTHIHQDVAMAAPVDGFVINSIEETLVPVVGDPFTTGTAGIQARGSVTGGWPFVVPNQANRYYVILAFANDPTISAVSKSLTASWAVSYWPRYLHVRPATT